MAWLIYKHINLINNKVYIGQSKYSWNKINDRWQDGRAYGKRTKMALAIKKYGWNNFSHELIEENIPSQKLANEREIYWINYYNSYYKGYNCTLGGKAIPENFIYKVKVYCFENKKTYNSIKEASQELNYSYHKIDRQIKTNHYFKKDKYRFCLEKEKDNINPTYYKIDFSKRDFSKVKRKVICIETKEIFNSASDCANLLGIKVSNIITNCCKNHKTAKGKHYSYLEDYNENWKPTEEYNNKKRKEVNGKKREIYCYQTNKFYKSATQCAKELNLDVRQIAKCCANILIQSHGYNFCFKEDWYEGWKPRKKKKPIPNFTNESIKKMRNNKHCKKVKCIETNIIYNSIKEAERNTKISADVIRNVCNKKLHCITAGGYHWEFTKE